MDLRGVVGALAPVAQAGRATTINMILLMGAVTGCLVILAIAAALVRRVL